MYNQSILKAFWKELASWGHGQKRYFYFQWFWLLGGRYFWYYNWHCFQGWWLMVFKMSKWLLTNLGTVTSISQMDAFLSTAYLQALKTNKIQTTTTAKPKTSNQQKITLFKQKKQTNSYFTAISLFHRNNVLTLGNTFTGWAWGQNVCQLRELVDINLFTLLFILISHHCLTQLK